MTDDMAILRLPQPPYSIANCQTKEAKDTKKSTIHELHERCEHHERYEKHHEYYDTHAKHDVPLEADWTLRSTRRGRLRIFLFTVGLWHWESGERVMTSGEEHRFLGVVPSLLGHGLDIYGHPPGTNSDIGLSVLPLHC